LYDNLRQANSISEEKEHLWSKVVMTNQSDVLNSWKEVSAYIGRGVRTVQRWEKDFGLPVRRPSGHLRGSVIALKADIDRWLGSRNAREAINGVATDGNGNGKSKHAIHEHYQRLQKNAHRLKENCSLLMRGAEELEANVRRIEVLRAKWRAVAQGSSG
jgi:hypothetical protein